MQFKKKGRVQFRIPYLTTAIYITLSFVVLSFVETSIHIEEQNRFTKEVNELTEDKYEYIEDKSNSEGKGIPTLAVDLDSYKEINADTVGYIHVPKIDLGIPVVQGQDNTYYLNKDFNKKDSRIGWVFLDARAFPSNLEENTVIYGHNVSTDNMFGKLKEMLNKPEEEMLVHYNIDGSRRVYEVVSMYVTNYEDWGYTQSQFLPSEKDKFIQDLKAKNTVNILKGTTVTSEDKILTLSTCHGLIGTTKRLVVHAKLIKEDVI